MSTGAFGVSRKPVSRDELSSSLAAVKSFVEKAEHRIAVVGGAAADLLQGLGAVQTKDDLASILAVDTTEQPDTVVVEARAEQVARLLGTLKQDRRGASPVLVYAPEALDPGEDRALRLAALTGLIRLARTPDQLIEQASLLQHAPVGDLPEATRATLSGPRGADGMLAGRHVLLIDDDIRNIFSMASALEEYGLQLSYAESGPQGLDLLRKTPDIDVALVDVMMPGMDGYETIREIRAMEGFRDLPVIAVTAKAMQGDRQKSIEAGATDYVAKPVDIDQLLSVLRVSIRRADAWRLASADANANANAWGRS
jgi:CheY-like chemotaxis protein